MRAPGLLYPRAITALCAALLSGACGGGDVSLPPDGQPATVTIMDGNEQTGRVGEPLAKPLLIEVSDSRGEPVGGATVAFEFSSAGPGAAVVPEQKTTNSDGQADARLVLGTTVGRQTGQVRVIAPAGSESVLAAFSATALPENANSMAAVGGQDQTGNVLRPLDDRLVVEVTDGFGNPVAGVPITWAAAGGGSVSEASVPTDEDGRSRVARILGPTVGQQTTLASAEGLAGSPVVFVHTAIAGDASRLTVESGDDQTGQAGSLLPAELVVRLIDSEGNGVPNTAVTWVPAVGGGTATPQNTVTDGDGRTSTGWTLGPALGDQRMDAVVSGVGVASFTATATAGAPASLFIRTQPSPTARNGIPLGRQPVIQLRDPQGNEAATAGMVVTVSLNGGGELEGTTRQTTDASGRATFTDLAISGAPGTRTLVFQAVGFAPVTSNEIVVSAIGTTTTITSDLPDPSQVGTPFTVSFRVTSDGSVPTGNVTVSDGVQSCTGALSNGAGSCQLTLATVGIRTLTATYAGTPGLNGSSDTEAHTVTAAPPPAPAGTTTTITADSPDPSVSRSDVSVSVQVASSAGTPTGSVIVTVSGGVGTCTIGLSGGAGSCVVRLDNVGSRVFTATYTGGPGFAGSSDTEDHTVTAEPPPPPPPTNQPPSAEFASSCAELGCRFEDQSTDPDGRIAQRFWEFGDGATSDSRDPRHDYGSAGTYTVRLTVTDNDGATDITDHGVTVSETAANTNTRFEVDDPDPTIPGQSFTVTLSVRSDGGTPEGTATVSDGVDGCTITIAGGSGSCTLALTTVGERTLTATYQGNASFATSSATENHRVDEPPPPNQPPAAAFNSPSCTAGQPCQFSDESTDDGTISSRNWTFQDGNPASSTDGNPSVTFASEGSKTVTLTVTDDKGATDTETKQVNVAAAPPPANQAPTAIIGSISCVGMICTFTDDSTDPDGNDTIVETNWIFGDGETSMERNPVHAYSTPNHYDVQLIVIDDGELSSTDSRRITVSAEGDDEGEG